ncbi:MAG: hypothetical protein FJ266_16170, partial [Planctomycetes bacterium]|nr:hypothetical protein [Planctomycetota bacterium]
MGTSDKWRVPSGKTTHPRCQAPAWQRVRTKSFALSKTMRSRYQIINDSGVYFVTSTIIEWIPVFTKKEYFDIIVQSLAYCRQNKGLKLFAYVVMDNHVHLIASANNLSQIMKDFKSYTAREIIK